MKYLCAFTALLVLFSCEKSDDSKSSDGGFELLKSSTTHIDFTNSVSDQKDFNVLTYRNYYNGGGVAIGDINNDGLNDIFFTGNMSDNKLYLNKGDMQFEDISTPAGVKGKSSWTTGVTMADVNADGFIDIYVCYSGDAEKQNKENELFINNGDLTFTERAAEFGLNDAGLSTHASFFDYDLDGDLDCYVLNNSYKDPERISLYSRERFEYDAVGGDRLYKNENGKFVNFTVESGIFSSNIGFGLGISTGDVNGDYYPDLFISNDFWERDYLYINQKNGTFKEELTDRLSYTSVASMGSDIADINNDGNMDIFTTDMLPPDNYRLKAATKFDEYYQFDLKFRNSYYFQFVQNCLQINDGSGDFTESAFFSGVGATDWSWAALIFDMNLDGKKDLFVSNGLFHDITDSDFVEFIADKEQIKKIVEEKGRYDFRDFVSYLPHNQRSNYAFINKGNLRFDNEAVQLNLAEPSYSNGSAYGDLDNDGDYDLVVNNVNMPAFIYQNKAVEKGSHFLKIKLRGPEKNAKGIGSTVWLYNNGEIQVAQSFSGRGFQSSVDSDLIFGLGEAASVDSIRIVWTDLQTEVIKNLQANSLVLLNHSEAKEFYENLDGQDMKIPDFRDVSHRVLANARHLENQYVDFDQDRLMPHMLSAEGPRIVKGDVNGDGFEDFILPGAKGQSDQLFVYSSGKYVPRKVKAFELEAKKEIVTGALFDADNDGDLDYLAGAGGNEFRDGAESFDAVFYENTGKGDFIQNMLKAPKIKGQIGCIKPFDIDKDGDIDLFVGGMAVPGGYGLTPRSFVFRNDGIQGFTDITAENTGPIGMVTDAVWSDVNADGFSDLIVVGEWMPVTIFMNDKGTLGKAFEVPKSTGWWNTIEAADFDGDGDMDYMLGNWGQNMKLKATENRPLNMYVGDFDQNKRPDVIMEWYSFEDQKPFPFASKMDLTTQLPALKKSILKYQEYGKKQVKDIFDEASLTKSVKKQVVNFSSSVLMNTPEGLVLHALQSEAQMSPVFSFEIADFDNDGITDYVVAGNYYRLKPEIGRHDGFRGGFFKGLGNGKFRFVNEKQSGLKIKGEVRDISMLNGQMVIARNNDSILIFEKNK